MPHEIALHFQSHPPGSCVLDSLNPGFSLWNMNVLEVTLLSIAAPLMIILFTVPLLLDVKGRQAWKNIPNEIYTSHRQQLLGIRPTYYWNAAALVSLVGEIFHWLKQENAQQIAQVVSFAIVAVILPYQLIWAVRILRSRAHLDARLVRFAHYAFWGSTAGLVGVFAFFGMILRPK